MKLLDWVKDKFDGDEPKAAPKPAAPVQGPGLSHEWKSAPRPQVAPGRADNLLPAAAAVQPRPALQAPGRPLGQATGGQTKAATPYPMNTPSWATTQPQPGVASNPWAAAEEQKEVMGPFAAPQEPTDAVRQLLTEQNWKLPEPTKKVRTPTELLDMDAATDLQEHSYAVAPAEWQLIQQTYGGAAGKSYGYETPKTPQNAGLTASPTTPILTQEGDSAAPLTWEAYEAMSGDQKAAVDFNTLLVSAREKDLSKSWDKAGMPADQKAEYDRRVRKVFGTNPSSGSEQFAPNTVKLLEEIDFQAVGQDLDEFLSLDRAIDMDEIGDFKFSKTEVKNLADLQAGGTESVASAIGAAPNANYAAVRTPDQLQAIDTAAVQKSQEFLKQVMSDPNNAIWSIETALATPEQNMLEQIPLGYGAPELRGTDTLASQWDSQLQGAYNSLSDPNTKDLAHIEQWFVEDQFTPEDKQIFLDYMDQRTRREMQYGGAPEGGRDPAEIRKMLGLGG
jgi:hypothetical protein